MKFVSTCVIAVAMLLAVLFGWSCLVGWLFMLLWNWILVGMCGVGYTMTYWVAVGAVWALSIVLKFILPHSSTTVNKE